MKSRYLLDISIFDHRELEVENYYLRNNRNLKVEESEKHLTESTSTERLPDRQRNKCF